MKIERKKKCRSGNGYVEMDMQSSMTSVWQLLTRESSDVTKDYTAKNSEEHLSDNDRTYNESSRADLRLLSISVS